ncbi:hypothetical protein EC55P2_00070 [Enterococcus phage EC55P2]|nr:hypothetical protein EC55P2_00070 [Enterococcus phage EC55P2]
MTEWRELQGFTKYDDDGHLMYTGIDDQLTELAKSYEILRVFYGAFSSSDWNVMSGGDTTALVELRKAEVK